MQRSSKRKRSPPDDHPVFQIARKLYDRKPELAAVLEPFDAMSVSGDPALVTVSGAAGIGKSALINSLRQPIIERGGSFIGDNFDERLHAIPYATIAQAFQPLVQQILAESVEGMAEWRQRILTAVGGQAQLIIDVLPQVELITGPQPPVTEPPPDQAQRFREAFGHFLGLFARPGRPLVLFLDDSQWIDAASLELLEHLLTHPDARFWMLIAAYRDNEVEAAHPLRAAIESIRGSGVTTNHVQLGPLPLEALDELVADSLHVPLGDSEPLTRTIYARAQGNPFLFIQLLASLGTDGLLHYDATDGSWRWDLEKIMARDFVENVAGLYSDLRERENRLNSLMESNIIAIAFGNANRLITEMNDAFLQLVGYSREELQSGSVDWADMTPPEYLAQDERVIETTLADGGISIPHEKELIRKDGTRVPVLVTGAFLDGSQSEGVAFMLDQTEQKQAQARIRHMAHYDSLTGLPNRVLLQDRVEQSIARARREGHPMAVLFLDIDHFKVVNDSLGHPRGDELLQTVAQRLRESTREGDTVARWGGDEFVACLPLLISADDAAPVAQKLLDALRRPFVIHGQELHASASIGISIFPDDGTTMDSLMRAADAAMYHAKEHGRGNYQFFTPALNEAAHQRLEVANQLSHALDHDEFVLHYQPQVNLETGEIFAAEALLRWQQPDSAPVSFGSFISAAEESGSILPIGEWVLRQACHQLRLWRDSGYSQLRVAVNLSPRQFYQHDFVGRVERILREAELPASALDLEITESVLLERDESTMETLNQLTEMGIKLAVDDFGTGYSSLSYLHRFPVSVLKIDQSFVSGIGRDSSETALVAGIIAMANSLQLTAIAEGVESFPQSVFLKSHGCRAAQGFYYSEPVPPAELYKMLGKPARLTEAR